MTDDEWRKEMRFLTWIYNMVYLRLAQQGITDVNRRELRALVRDEVARYKAQSIRSGIETADRENFIIGVGVIDDVEALETFYDCRRI